MVSVVRRGPRALVRMLPMAAPPMHALATPLGFWFAACVALVHSESLEDATQATQGSAGGRPPRKSFATPPDDVHSACHGISLRRRLRTARRLLHVCSVHAAWTGGGCTGGDLPEAGGLVAMRLACLDGGYSEDGLSKRTPESYHDTTPPALPLAACGGSA